MSEVIGRCKKHGVALGACSCGRGSRFELDCGDNSCEFHGKGRGGMRTNGGCRCLDLPFEKRMGLRQFIHDENEQQRAWKSSSEDHFNEAKELRVELSMRDDSITCLLNANGELREDNERLKARQATCVNLGRVVGEGLEQARISALESCLRKAVEASGSVVHLHPDPVPDGYSCPLCTALAEARELLGENDG